MKTILLGVVPLTLFLGCGDSQSTSTEPTGTTSSTVSPLDAPGEYVGGMGRAQQSAIKTVDTASLNQAIQMFNIEEGRFPKDLDELVAKQYLPRIPEPPRGMKIVYDPASGEVSIVAQ